MLNANDLRKLKTWCQVESPLDIDTNLALAFRDFLVILDVGDEDITEVLGTENMEYIKGVLAERPSPIMDEGVRAFRSAKTLFEPEKGLGEYGLMPTTLRFSDRFWDNLDETEDGHFVIRGPLVFDQNTRTVWMWGGDGAIESMLGPMRLEQDQRAFAISAMKKAGSGLLEVSIP